MLLFLSCWKKSDSPQVSSLLDPNISPLAKVHLTTMESALSNEVDKKFYTIIGPFFLPKNVVLTEEFKTATSPRYVVQEEDKILYYAFDKRFKFVQEDKVFYFIFKNETLIQTLKSRSWPILINEANNTFKDFGGSEAFRNKHVFKDAQSAPLNQELSNELRDTLSNENPISSSPPPGTHECCRYRHPTTALVVRAGRDKMFETDEGNIVPPLRELGYSVTTLTNMISSEDELYRMIEEIRVGLASNPACCPIDTGTCCAEIVVYITGHGNREGIAIERPQTETEWNTYTANPLISYARLAQALRNTASKQCINLTVILDACHSGSAMTYFQTPTSPSCKVCVHTSTTADKRSFGNWYTGDFKICESAYHGQVHSIGDLAECMRNLLGAYVGKNPDGSAIYATDPQKNCF